MERREREDLVRQGLVRLHGEYKDLPRIFSLSPSGCPRRVVTLSLKDLRTGCGRDLCERVTRRMSRQLSPGGYILADLWSSKSQDCCRRGTFGPRELSHHPQPQEIVLDLRSDFLLDGMMAPETPVQQAGSVSSLGLLSPRLMSPRERQETEN